MATFPKLLKLRSGAHDRTPFNLSSRTITTGEFFQFAPVKCIECVPGDKFKINMSVFARTAPLAVPPFDRAVIQSRAFFIPHRLSHPYFNEFITGEKVSVGANAFTPGIPVIGSQLLVEFFATKSISVGGTNYKLSTAVQSTDEWDFEYQPSSGSTQYRVLSEYGRSILKIFEGLGYKWNWVSPSQSAWSDLNVEFSALPLMAFMRVFLDWFVPSQLQAAHPIHQIFNSWKAAPTTFYFDPDLLKSLFESVCVAYDEDYFTSAWLYPNEVGGDSNRIVPPTIFDFGSPSGNAALTDSNKSVVDRNNTYLTRDSTSSNAIARISQYGLNLLEGLANYVTRNNFAGSRAVEQILARFGIRVPDTRFNRSEFLGKDDTDIQFQEVTSMADSGNYDVGQFAGKGVAYNKNGLFEYECKEYGYILIVSTIVPKISYVQGFDRHVIHKDRFDFFTPEFDCVGPQAISSGELYCDTRDKQDCSFQDVQANNGAPNAVFGYCPRYTEYKINHDLLCGDFNVPHLNDGGALNAFHFARFFYPSQDTPSQAQGPFLFAHGRQYNRIFNVQGNADHFYMWYNFEISAWRPMRSISDSIPLEGDGERVDLQPNGVHMS